MWFLSTNILNNSKILQLLWDAMMQGEDGAQTFIKVLWVVILIFLKTGLLSLINLCNISFHYLRAQMSLSQCRALCTIWQVLLVFRNGSKCSYVWCIPTHPLILEKGLIRQQNHQVTAIQKCTPVPKKQMWAFNPDGAVFYVALYWMCHIFGIYWTPSTDVTSMRRLCTTMGSGL